jgi:predicted RNase H-like nuclease (RuvC/YqgF family)
MIENMASDSKKVTAGADEPDESKVIEGEIVSGNSVNSDTSDQPEISETLEGSDQANTIMNLENMIKTNNAQINKLSIELAEARDVLKDAFEGDTTYREHAEVAKEANKVKSATKAQIMKKPDVAQIATQVKVLTSELKELKVAFSDYLKEFNRLSGLTEIDDNGELLEIVYVAKLVKKRV